MCFKENGLFLQAVEEICSIDLKKDEEGLNSLCRRLGMKLVTYPPEDLNALEGVYSSSAFVSKTTGTDNVCERSAMMKGGRLLVKKWAYRGVTVAVALKGGDWNYE